MSTESNSTDSFELTDAGSVNIRDFEYNGADFLYNLESLCKSTFYSTVFQLDNGANTGLKLPNAGYRLKSVAINGMKLQWDDVNSFKQFANIKGVNQGTTCTFSWVEDNFRTVELFHKAWLNNWYSRQNNCFKSGAENKFVNTKVYAYHYVLKDGKLKAEVTQSVSFEGLAPTDLLEAKYDVDDDGNQIVTYTYKYMQAIQQFYTANAIKYFNQGSEEYEFWKALDDAKRDSFYL